MIQVVDSFYDRVFRILPDPRTKDLFPVSNYGFTLSVLIIYLLTCLVVGPKFMKNRKPYELKKIISIYNLAMVLLCSYVAYETLVSGWGTNYTFFCQPIGAADDKGTFRMINAHYFFLITKFFELLDTVFFMLRKKNSQITFLHVYHHAIVVILALSSMRYMPDGHATLIVLLNSSVHVVMYSYYFLSALGPKVQQYLWWKQYLTKIQLIQFIVMVAHMLVVFHPSCNYPRALPIVYIVNVVVFLVLFVNFYKKRYTRKNQLSDSELEFACLNKNK